MQLIKKISESGVKVIVSGSAIAEMALHFIERYQMMIVKVPSKFELRRLCQTVGATPLVRLVCLNLLFFFLKNVITVD